MEYGLVLVWLVALFTLGAIGLPIATYLFPQFLGAALALPCSFVVLIVTAYWVGHVWFGWVAPLAGVAAVVLAAVLAKRSSVNIQPRAYLGAAGVFTVAFLVIILFRVVSPGIVPAGGEKFLDYALLKSILRANVLPPEDPWFAGQPVRYYYGAHLWAALLIRLTGTPPQFGYNLALATAFATLVTTAYGLAGALADAHGRSARVGGLFGAFLVGFAGNLATPIRLLFGFLPEPLALRYGHGVFGAIRAPYAVAVQDASSINQFSHWFARYVIEGTLTPFPLWAFFNGDLNAYMVATPFLLLVAALCFAYYKTPQSAVGHRRLIVFVAIPLTGGLLGFTSTWSVPTTVGLVWLTLIFGEADPATLLPETFATRIPRSGVSSGDIDLLTEIWRVLVAASLAVVSTLVVIAVASPFLLFHTPVNNGVGFLPPRTDFIQLVLVWGIFLIIFAFFEWPRIHDQIDRWPATILALIYLFLVIFLVGSVLLEFDLAAVVLVAPFLLIGWLLLCLNDTVGYETILVVAGAGLILIIEFVYARVYPFSNNLRWNTVFKISMQVWILWSVASAAMLADILGRVRENVGGIVSDTNVTDGAILRPALTVLTVVVILLGSASFGVLTFSSHFDQPLDSHPESFTLDGTKYVETYYPADDGAINWLNNRSDTPTIVSKPGVDTYTWVNAPSSLTGVPTVLGWSHEIGYRGQTAYSNRRNDIAMLYTTNDTATIHALLDKYDIRYIYVGANERTAYDGDQNFSTVPKLHIAYQNSNVTIYGVQNSVVHANSSAP